MDTNTGANLGDTLKFKVPSGFDLTIREQNGEDDETISKMKHALKGDSVNAFVAAIVLKSSIDGDGIVSMEKVNLWKNRDKYYALLKSRMFSLGNEITYDHTCSNSNCGKTSTYEEDLLPYDRDFSLPSEETKTDFKYQVQPYTYGLSPQIELRLTSGKELRYKYLNGESEKKLLDMDKNEVSKNTDISVRSLEWNNNGTWQKIQSFKMFSSREMAEIRKHIKENDMPFEVLSECICPYCSNKDYISLISQPGFFFPGEI